MEDVVTRSVDSGRGPSEQGGDDGLPQRLAFGIARDRRRPAENCAREVARGCLMGGSRELGGKERKAGGWERENERDLLL